MDQARDVIRFVFEAHDGTGEFASEDGGGDAMLPKAAPWEGSAAGKFLEIFDDRSDDGELADLANAEVEDGFLDGIDGVVEAVIDGIHQAEETGGEAGIAADDFGNLRGEAIIGMEEVAQGSFDAAERGKPRRVLDALDDSGAVAGFYGRNFGKQVHH